MASIAAHMSIHFHSSASPGCPSSHPFAYLNGDYCCKTNKEKVHRPSGSKCDGSSISIDSICCAGDDHVRCPIGAKKCGVKKTGERFVAFNSFLTFFLNLEGDKVELPFAACYD